MKPNHHVHFDDDDEHFVQVCVVFKVIYVFQQKKKTDKSFLFIKHLDVASLLLD